MIIAWKFLKYISSHCCSLEQGLFLYLYQYFVLYFVFVSIFCWGIWLLFARASWGPAAGRGQAPVEREPPTRTEQNPPTRHLLSLDKPARLTIVPVCQMRYKNTNSGTPPQGSSFLQHFENPQRWRWYERGKNICSSKHKKIYSWVTREHPVYKPGFFLQICFKEYLLSKILFAANHCIKCLLDLPWSVGLPPVCRLVKISDEK